MSEFGPVNVTPNTAQRARATFYGTSFHKVSGRNQVALPKNQKRVIDDAQEGQILLLRFSQEPYLRLYTKMQFDKKLDEVKEILGKREDLSEEQKFSCVANLASAAEPVEPDSQGRFVLKEGWVDTLNIKDEVAFCGVGNFIQIWPAELKREAAKVEPERMAAVAPQIASILNM